MKYDYIIVGSGLYGSICAHELRKKNFSVLIIERRSHVGGNIYTENIAGINVHKYGAHIFHTNDKEIWDYMNQFAEFNRFTNSPLANYKGKLYNLPFNMNTFYQLWGVKTPQEAREIIAQQKEELSHINTPSNLEEQAISLVGKDIYNILIKGYTEKQWGKSAKDLPAFIINRIPVRFTFDNNYFNDKCQGIPIGGYTKIINKLIQGVDVITSEDYLQKKEHYNKIAKKIIYTGPIDEYYSYCFGELEYRSLKFHTEILDTPNFQGNAVINYTEGDIEYTRIIEHKHFEFTNSEKTVITKEYSQKWTVGEDAYYPINDLQNMERYKLYRRMANEEKNIIFGGRLGEYKYYDMHQVVRAALNTVNKLLSEIN